MQILACIVGVWLFVFLRPLAALLVSFHCEGDQLNCADFDLKGFKVSSDTETVSFGTIACRCLLSQFRSVLAVLANSQMEVLFGKNISTFFAAANEQRPSCL